MLLWQAFIYNLPCRQLTQFFVFCHLCVRWNPGSSWRVGRGLFGITKDCLPHPLGGLLVSVREQVALPVKSDLNGGVSHLSLDVFRVLPLRNQNRGAGPGSSSLPFGTIKNKGLCGNRVTLFLSPDCGLYRFCTTCEELLKQGTKRQAHSTVRCCVRSFEDLSYQL